MTDPHSPDRTDGPRASRRDLLKGLVVGGTGKVESRLDALKGLVTGRSVRSDPATQPPGEWDEGAGARTGATAEAGGADAAGLSTAQLPPSPVPVRAMEHVSMRSIAKDTAGVSGPPYALTDVADERGLLDPSPSANPREEPPFALREVVTPQNVTSQKIKQTSTQHNSQWDNWVDDHERSLLAKFRPTTKRELVEAVLWNARQNESIRAVGSGHSHSKAAAPEDRANFIQLSWYDTGGNNTTLEGLVDELQRKWLVGGSGGWNDLVRVEAGATIKYLNRKLLKDQGKALKNMGSFDGQTLAGAVNTSTHGTGARLQALSDSVRSVELITVVESPAQPGTPLVRSYRIEPSSGITDREAFESDVGKHGTTLIQDDEVFDSVVVGYGCMGVAYAYTLEVRDRFFLHEDARSMLWNDFKNYIADLRGEPDYSKDFRNVVGARHFQFRVNIADVDANDNLNPRCLLLSHREPHRYGGTAINFDAWPSEPSWWSATGLSWPPERTGKSTVRKLLRRVTGVGLDPTSITPGFPIGVDRRFKRAQKQDPFKYQPPPSNQYVSGRVPDGSKTASYIALRRKPEKKPAAEAIPEPPPRAISTELAVPADQVVTAVEAVFEEIRENGYAYHLPMGVRFVDRSEHFLSPEYRGPADRDVPVAKVEVPFIVEPVKQPVGLRNGTVQKTTTIPHDVVLERGKEALALVERRLNHEVSAGNLDFARPHLGKTNEVTTLSNDYDEFGTWEAVHREFDAFGTFDNGFTDEKNISFGDR